MDVEHMPLVCSLYNILPFIINLVTLRHHEIWRHKRTKDFTTEGFTGDGPRKFTKGGRANRPVGGSLAVGSRDKSPVRVWGTRSQKLKQNVKIVYNF